MRRGNIQASHTHSTGQRQSLRVLVCANQASSTPESSSNPESDLIAQHKAISSLAQADKASYHQQDQTMVYPCSVSTCRFFHGSPIPCSLNLNGVPTPHCTGRYPEIPPVSLAPGTTALRCVAGRPRQWLWRRLFRGSRAHDNAEQYTQRVQVVNYRVPSQSEKPLSEYP